MTGDLDSNYARAGYHQKIGFGKHPALLLIDFVEAYFDKESPLYAGVEETLATALRVLAAARDAGIFTIFTNVKFKKGGVDGGVFIRKVPALKILEDGNSLGGWPRGLVP